MDASCRRSNVPRPPLSNWLISIDFGTVYSAAAIVRMLEANFKRGIQLSDIQIVGRYPDGDIAKKTNDEVPSLSVYRGSKLEQWGYEAEAFQDNPDSGDVFHYNLIELPKLLLDETIATKGIRDRLMGQLRILGLQPEDVISDYLRELYQIIDTFIDSIDNAVRRNVEVVLCVPAIWTPLAQKKMRIAAQMAGMLSKPENVRLISEPEALAAFYFEKNPKPLAAYIWDGSATEIRVGDHILVLDSGGGTADVSALRVIRQRPLAFSQIIPTNGGLCGSAFIDEAFGILLRYRLDHVDYFSLDEKAALIRNGVGQFKRRIKRYFGSNAKLREGGHCVKIPGLLEDPKHNFSQNWVSFSDEEIKEIFDPIIEQNIQLVRAQIASYETLMEEEGKDPQEFKCILFGGGLSGSPYATKKLRHEFWPETNIPVLTQGEQGATAVAQGALLLASNQTTASEYRIRQSYGILRNEWYDKTVHGNSKWNVDPLDNRWIVTNRLKWIVRKNDIVTNDPTRPFIRSSGEIYYDVKQDAVPEFTEILYRSDKVIRDGVHFKNFSKDIERAYELRFNLAHATDAREVCYPELSPYLKRKREQESPELRTASSRQASTREPFYRYRCEIIVKIIGMELTFEVVAPPGGKVRQAGVLDIAPDLGALDIAPLLQGQITLS